VLPQVGILAPLSIGGIATILQINTEDADGLSTQAVGAGAGPVHELAEIPRPRPTHERKFSVPANELRVALTVEDHAQAVSFYRDALGLTQLADWSSANGKVVLLDAGIATLELVDTRQAAWIDQIEVGQRVAGPVRLALSTADADSLAEHLARAGAQLLGGPVDTPWGDRNARLRAPDGMQLTLFPTHAPPSEWPWPHGLDALIAAPDSHRLLLENDRVRVLEVMIAPGAREPEHTHRWPSVMIVDQAARIRYHEHGIQTFESPASGPSQPGPRAVWMDAEGPHSVENIDTMPYHALRIELRDEQNGPH
jgi:lactoylglutathione lyase